MTRATPCQNGGVSATDSTMDENSAERIGVRYEPVASTVMFPRAMPMFQKAYPAAIERQAMASATRSVVATEAGAWAPVPRKITHSETATPVINNVTPSLPWPNRGENTE